MSENVTKMKENCASATHEEMSLDGLEECKFCRCRLDAPDPEKLKARQQEPTTNDILEKYHQKFDDNRINEIKEELEEMAGERAAFFSSFPEDIRCRDDLDKYWEPFNDMPCAMDEALSVFEDVKKDVEGLHDCGNCNNFGVVKSKLLSSMMGNRLVIAKLCETCYGDKKTMAPRRRMTVDADTDIPSDLSDEEKDMVKKFQENIL